MFDALNSASIELHPGQLPLVGAVQALMMVIVSLHLDPAQLRRTLGSGKSLLVGLAAQWLLLPALTLALAFVLRLPANAAAGLLLVAACPGGAAAAYLSLVGRGNAVLCVGLSAIATLAAAVLTPAVFGTGAWLLGGSGGNAGIHLDFVSLLRTALGLMLLPLLAGLVFRWRFPQLALRLRQPLKLALGLILGVLVVGALYGNAGKLAQLLTLLVPLVALHNGLGLLGGYLLAWAARLPAADRRAIALGTGITNSGLSVVLAFSLFPDSAATIAVVMWWSAWRLLSGGVMALCWARGATPSPAAEEPAVPVAQ